LESDMSSSMKSSTILEMRRPKDHTLTITLAVAFRLDTVFAHWSFLATLEAAFTTGQTSGFASLTGKFDLGSCLCLASVSAVLGELVVAVIVGRVVSGVGIHLAEVSFLGERVHCCCYVVVVASQMFSGYAELCCLKMADGCEAGQGCEEPEPGSESQEVSATGCAR
jgi:hypothetical protein